MKKIFSDYRITVPAISILMGLCIGMLISNERRGSQSPSPDIANSANSAGKREGESDLRNHKKSPRAVKLKPSEIPGVGTMERVVRARKSSQRPPYDLFDSEAFISRSAVADLKIDETKAMLLQSETQNLLAQARAEIVNNLHDDPLRSDPDKGIRAFYVAPFNFNDQFDSYAKNLVTEFGHQLAGQILMAFPLEKYYGNFGANEVQFKVLPEIDEDAPEIGYSIEIRGNDAVSGKQVFRANTFSSHIDKTYPGVFDIEMQARR